jgi:hypothetical protein
MNYKQFAQSISESVLGSEIVSQASVYGSTVVGTASGDVFIDNVQTDFSSLEEAKQYLKQQHIQEDIQKKIQQDLYEEMSYNKIADIIREHHGEIKVTDTLIESYVELASSKLFTLDPVAHDITKFNKLDHIVEGRLDYRLDDGTSVVVTEETYQQINKVFAQHPDVVEYMRSNAENFLTVINALEE